ncbi:MAG: molybdopterin converting factor subunit 1 [Rhodospirillales bacterium]
MKLLYFSWLREKIGIAEEDALPPKSVTTVATTLEWLKSRGGGYEDALKDLALVRVAVNQNHAKLDDPVSPDDEVALFPPVTGG